MKTPWTSRALAGLMLAVCLTVAALLGGCGSTTASHVQTRVDPATVSLTDHFAAKAPAETHTAKVTISAPPTAPAPIAPIAPLAAAPVPIPASPSASVVAVTQAPTPVSVNVSGRTVTAPAGSTVTIEAEDTHFAAENVHDRGANASGATLLTNADKGNFDASAPKVELGNVTNEGVEGTGSSGGGGNATGGKTGTDWVATALQAASAASTATKWLVGLGVLVMLAGIVWGFVAHMIGGTADWALIALLEVAGMGLIATGIVIDQHPYFFVFTVLAIIGGIVWYELYWKGKGTPALVKTAETDAAALLKRIEEEFVKPSPAPAGGGTVATAAPAPKP